MVGCIRYQEKQAPGADYPMRTCCYSGNFPPGWVTLVPKERPTGKENAAPPTEDQQDSCTAEAVADGAVVRCDGHLSCCEESGWTSTGSSSATGSSTGSVEAQAGSSTSDVAKEEASPTVIPPATSMGSFSATSSGSPSGSPKLAISQTLATSCGVRFAPGQTITAVIDRRSNRFLLGIEAPYMAPTAVFRLPSDVSTDDASTSFSYHIVLCHYGTGEVEVELLNATTSAAGNAATPAAGAGSLSRSGSGVGIRSRTSSFGGRPGTGGGTTSSAGQQAAQLWERDGSHLPVYLQQRSDESMSELNRLADLALATLGGPVTTS